MRPSNGKRTGKHPADWGGKWIRREKRWQVYERDGFRCVYCQVGLDNPDKMTLEHVEQHSVQQNNDPRNLALACKSCNSSRSEISLEKFMPRLVRKYHVKPKDVRKRLARCKHKALPPPQNWTVEMLKQWWEQEALKFGATVEEVMDRRFLERRVECI
jgi:hypothetical protein